MTNTTYKLSEQQLAVLDWVKNGKGSLIVNALAGVGKTTLLLEIAKAIKGMGDGYMGAFNAAIAEEFKEKLAAQGSYWVKGSTLHSAGLSAWRKVAKKIGSPDGRKVEKLARQVCAWDRKIQAVIRQGVEYGKIACLGVEGCDPYKAIEPWQKIFEYYDLNDELTGGAKPEMVIEMCQTVYKQSLDLCEATIDFTDMILAPLYFKAPIWKYDWVLGDELQDSNTARRLLLFAMMKPSSRMVAVGDKNQAIFGFNGASSNSMELIAEEMKKRGECTELPLSITYRCPKSVVAVAQQWVPEYTAAPSAPQGLVTNINHLDLWNQKFAWNDFIICRNTRPLVGIAQRLRDKGIQCVVEGQSGKALIGLAIKWGEDLSIEEFKGLLEAYRDKECAKWEAKGNGDKVEYTIDKCGTLMDLASKLKKTATTADLAKKIEYLFGDTPGVQTLRLCTIHRVKGREANRVYLIGRNRYMPSIYARKDWEISQEMNLQYVAVTRAKVELVEVEVPFKKRKSDMEWWEEGWRQSESEEYEWEGA